MRLALIVVVSISPTANAQKAPKQTEVKVQKTSMSRDQEIQLGKEAAAQVEHEMEVIKNPEVEAWLNQIGQGLAKAPQANAYPYYFKLVNEDSTNAFALPGGPMYVHTGLIKAADTEGEVAGVLAHEMTTKTSSQQAPEQVVYLYTVAQEAGLWYVALAAPSAQAGEFEPLAKQIVAIVLFPK